MSKKSIFILIFTLVAVIFLKITYLEDICSEPNISSYRSLVVFTSNNFVNFIWIFPIIINIFIIAKNLYYKLIMFDVRYKNRNLFLRRKLIDSAILNFLICFFTILVQWGIFIIFFKANIVINEVAYIIFFKYLFEVFLQVILIVFIALYINNFIYSFVYVLLILLLFVCCFQNFYIPFVTLYAGYCFNVIDVIILIVLLFLIKKIYIRKDLGGVKNEIDS